MPINHLVDALNNQSFLPEQITTLLDFRYLHKGKTLFEHMAQQPNYLALMQAGLLRAAQLMDDAESDHRREYDFLFGELLAQVREYVGQKENLETLNHLVENPKDCFNFLDRSSKSFHLRFNEYWNLEGKQTPLLRLAIFRGQVAKIIAQCATLAALKDFKGEFRALLKDPIFSTHDTYAGGAAQGMMSWFGGYLTETGAKISNIISVLETIDATDYQTLKEKDVLAKIQALGDLYPGANQAVQAEIVASIEALLRQHHTQSITDAAVDIMLPPPVGKAVRVHSDPSGCLLAKLSPEVNVDILKSLMSHCCSLEERVYLRTVIGNVTHARSGITLEMNFNAQIAAIKRKVSAILGLGNFPELKYLNVILMMNSDENRQQMLCLAGSQKVRFVCTPGQSCRDLLTLNTYSVFPYQASLLLTEAQQISYWKHSVVHHLCENGLHAMQVHVKPIDKSYYPSLIEYINHIGELPAGCSISFFIPINGVAVKELVYRGQTIIVENKKDEYTPTKAPALVAFRPISPPPGSPKNDEAIVESDDKLRASPLIK